MADGEVRSKWVRTRKPHSCVWCGWEILVGAKARFQVYSYDGYLNNAHYHEACVGESRRWLREMGESEFLHGTGEEPPFPALLKLEISIAALEPHP